MHIPRWAWLWILILLLLGVVDYGDPLSPADFALLVIVGVVLVSLCIVLYYAIMGSRVAVIGKRYPSHPMGWVVLVIGMLFGFLNLLFWLVHLYLYSKNEEKTIFGVDLTRRFMKFGTFMFCVMVFGGVCLLMTLFG